MAKHPQNSHRGMFSKSAIAVGSTGIFSPVYSDGTAVMTFESTGGLNLVGTLSLGGSGEDIAQDSTGIDLPGTFTLSGSAGKDISQDSTGALLIPTTLSLLAGSTAVVLAANSTGLTIDSAQISTA